MNENRGRVPFALVGVILLLGSVVYTTGLTDRGVTDGGHQTVSRALDRAEATARPIVRATASQATRSAARRPVVTPANTTVGRALDPDHPFRDALRLRIYRRVADGLDRSTVRVGTTQVTSGLPPVARSGDPTTAAIRRAIEHVTLSQTADGGALRVTVSGITHTAFRDGERVAREHGTLTVTVRTPVLAMHRRTMQYARQLERSPTAGPGLGRRLTGRVTVIAAARGLAQYGGVPIGNVLANRHVELATNGATLALQRATFGSADPEGEAALLRASARVGLTDVLAARSPGPWSSAVLGVGRSRTSRAATFAPATADRTVAVGVNGTADTAAVAVLDRRLDTLIRKAYRATVVRRVSVVRVERESPPRLRSPGRNWSVRSVSVTNTTSVRRPDTPSNETLPAGQFADTRRIVRTIHRRRVVWRNGTRTRTIVSRWTTRRVVRVTLLGRYTPGLPGPVRPTDSPFDGALAGVVDRAHRRLPATGRAADRLARRVVQTGGRIDRATIQLDPPSAVRDRVVTELLTLRDRVRNLTVGVPSRRVASGRGAERLAALLRDQRRRLLDPPSRYTSVERRLRVAVRTAYLHRVQRGLAARGEQASSIGDRLTAALTDVGDTLGHRFRAVSRKAARVTRPSPRPLATGPAGPVVLVPDSDPAYLSVTSLDARHVERIDHSVTPLAARNRNVFTVPYADIADSIVGSLAPTGQRVPLVVAGRAARDARRTLAAANASRSNERVEQLDRTSRELRRTVRTALQPVHERTREILTTRLGIDNATAATVVTTARAAYSGPGAVAVAVADGSYARTVARIATARVGVSPTARDTLALRLRVQLRETVAKQRVSVPQSAVNRTVRARRAVLRAGVVGEATAAVGRAYDTAAKRVKRQVPPLAGLPVAPVPGSWYATINVWLVTVRGEYPRFTVTARVGNRSDAPIARYVREDRAIAFDADGDGVAERVGYNRPITFRTRAIALAVVPPGKSGVGDTGDAVERSSAWACPGGPACGNSSSKQPVVRSTRLRTRSGPQTRLSHSANSLASGRESLRLRELRVFVTSRYDP